MEGSTVVYAKRIKSALATAAYMATQWLNNLAHPAERETLKAILEQYYWVQRYLLLGIIRYDGRLADLILDNRYNVGLGPSDLEGVLGMTMRVTADEQAASSGYVGKDAYPNHLLRMGKKVGMQTDLASLSQPKLSSPTMELMSFIERALENEDAREGLALVSAIEAMLPPVMISLRDYALSYVDEEGHAFTQEEMAYLDLHFDYDGQRAAYSEGVYEVIRTNDQLVKLVEVTAHDLEPLFAAFWKQFETVSEIKIEKVE